MGMGFPRLPGGGPRYGREGRCRTQLILHSSRSSYILPRVLPSRITAPAPETFRRCDRDFLVGIRPRQRIRLRSNPRNSCIYPVQFFFSSRRVHTRLQGDWSSDVCSSDLVAFFFFSSRRRHTRLQGDWSSDVCSSD